MIYSRERANTKKNDDRAQFIPAGIHENITIKSAKTDKSIKEKLFFEIIFEKDNLTFTQTEWEPQMSNYCTTQEQLQQKVDNQYSRMLQILSCFYPDSELNFNGDSFKEFAEWVVSMINHADLDKKLKVKVVYNDKNYSTLPNYAKYTFIEPMELPEGETSKIAELNIDKFTKSVIADSENNTNNTEQSSVNMSDGLPF